MFWDPAAAASAAMWELASAGVRAGAQLSASAWLQLAVAAAAAVLVYRLVLRPVDWVRDLTDVGYSHVRPGGRRSRADAVRDVRRRRRLGALPPVYPNGWFALAESDRLRPGQVEHVAALGENFAVLRTADGEAHVLDAYCPHLGANMAVGGAVRGDCLECPFHGWRFRASDGRCTAVPYADKVPEFAKVRRWQSTEANGFLFVWYHAEGGEPTWRPESAPQVAAGDWIPRGRSEFLINAHIQEIPENGGDVAHLNAIHAPSVLAGGALGRGDQLPFSFLRHVWSATWEPQAAPDCGHRATMRLRHEMRLWNKISCFSMNVRAEQIGPGYVEMWLQTSFGPVLLVQVVTPQEPLLQRVLHRVFVPPRLVLLANFMIVCEAVMFERDIMVWNHKTYEDKPLLVREDRTIQRHRRWYSQFYSDNSPRFSFARDSPVDCGFHIVEADLPT